MAANSSTDDVTIIGAASIPATGLQGSGNVGSIVVAANANTAVTGLSATASTSSVSPFTAYQTTGVSATGGVGQASVVGVTFVQVTGVSSIGVVGTTRHYTPIDLLSVPADPYSALVIDAPVDDVYTEVDLTEEPEIVWTDLDVAA